MKCPNSGCSYHGDSVGIGFHSRRCKFQLSQMSASKLRPAGSEKRRKVSKERSIHVQLGGLASRVPSDNISIDSGDQYRMEQDVFISQAMANTESIPVVGNRESQTVRGSEEAHHGDRESQELQAELAHSLGMAMVSISRKVGNKEASNLLRIITDPRFSSEMYRKMYPSIASCKNITKERFHREMEGKGFTKKAVLDPQNKILCHIYSKSPISVLQNQIRNASGRNSYFRHVKHANRAGEISFGHPMAAKLGGSGARAVEMAVKASQDNSIVWCEMGRDSQQSFVGMGQMYSDKSATSLKASTFTFYPVHLTLHNFSEKERRRFIVEGLTVVGYLPVEFYNIEEVKASQRSTFGRPDKLRMLHASMSTVFEELIRASEKGFECIDMDGVNRRCHFALGSYVSDIPEAKDICSVLSGTSTACSCTRCYVSRDMLPESSNAPLRTLQDTTSAQERYVALRKDAAEARASGNKLLGRTKKLAAEQQLGKLSVTMQKPFLHAFPFMGLDPSLEMYNLFTFEPLHNLHLGVSKLLKNVASERLSSKEMYTSAFKYANGQPRTFHSIRSNFLNGANFLLSRYELESAARGFHVDFSSKGKGLKDNGLFKTDGLMGMLEAKDYRNVDQVSPFIGAFFDQCCGEIEDAPVTKVFTKYVDILRKSHRHGEDPAWTEKEVCELERRIKEFKEVAVRVFADYQPSGMGTLKFHLLDHIGDDIRRMGGLQFGDAGLYEHSHVYFKQQYRGTSKRSKTALEETLTAIDTATAVQELQSFIPGKLKSTTRSNQGRRTVSSRMKCVLDDNATLTRGGSRFNLDEFENGRKLSRKLRKAELLNGNERVIVNQKLREQWSEVPTVVQDMISAAGEDGARVFHSLVQDEFIPSEFGEGISSKELNIERISSCFIPGYGTPSIDAHYSFERNDVSIEEDSKRWAQKIFAVDNYYKTGRARQDCVIVESARRGAKQIVWFAKLLMLLRFKLSGLQRRDEKTTVVKEVAFVQYFECTPPRNAVEVTLGCVCLKWARGTGSDGEGPVSRWFGIVPITSVRGRVQVVRANYGVEGLFPEPNWDEHRFYVNRFYRDREEAEYLADEK